MRRSLMKRVFPSALAGSREIPFALGSADFTICTRIGRHAFSNLIPFAYHEYIRPEKTEKIDPVSPNYACIMSLCQTLAK